MLNILHIINLNTLRWRVQCDDLTNGPGAKVRLVLEAIVLKEGQEFAGLPPETKKVLSSASSKAFCLWLCPIEWHSPIPHLYLATKLGIHERGDNILLPSDSSVRFHLQAVMD